MSYIFQGPGPHRAQFQKFYEGFGFKVVGDVYDEDGIPHVEMLKDG